MTPRTSTGPVRAAVAIALGVVLTLAAAAPGAQAGFNVCGDPSNNGVVDSIDALYILQYDAGLLDLPKPAFGASDVDGNGDITARDALLILQYDAGLVAELDCGF